FLLFGLCLAAYLITPRRRDQLILFPLGAAAIAGYIILHTTNEPASMKLLDKFFWVGFCVYLLMIVFREIFNAREIKSQEIYGAISAYLLLGVIFAQLFDILLIFDSAAIAFDPENFDGGILQNGDVLYFSFVTLATVGYGDLTPATPLARALCVVESITGVMYVAIFIARFVSMHSGRSAKHE
ncbi:MAG: potassium channel family protein, partial [Pseudomonadota bacterium]